MAAGSTEGNGLQPDMLFKEPGCRYFLLTGNFMKRDGMGEVSCSIECCTCLFTSKNKATGEDILNLIEVILHQCGEDYVQKTDFSLMIEDCTKKSALAMLPRMKIKESVTEKGTVRFSVTREATRRWRVMDKDDQE